MKRLFHPLGVATALVAALAFTLPGTARAQPPPKDMVAFKVVANTKIDAAGILPKEAGCEQTGAHAIAGGNSHRRRSDGTTLRLTVTRS
jgi:hypothetical protein